MTMPEYEPEKKVSKPHRFTLLILTILGVSQVVGSWLFFQGMDHYDLMAQAYLLNIVETILLIFIAAELTMFKRHVEIEYYIPEKIEPLPEVNLGAQKKQKAKKA